MDRHDTIRYANHIRHLHNQELELWMNLARFVAGAKLQQAAAEVRG